MDAPHPRSRVLRVGPPLIAGVGCLWLAVVGLLGSADVVAGANLLWRPLVTVAAIMVMTGAAHRLGLFDCIAATLLPRARGSSARLFALVFGVSAATSGVLNNDAAVLLLTPAVVVLVRRAYPDQPAAVGPFALAVFMAAGVAPLVVSNPMNMIVAEFAGVGFNAYMARMLPISLLGYGLAFVLLRWLFRGQLRALTLDSSPAAARVPLERKHGQMLALLVIVLLAYPVVSSFGGPIWAVAAAGAAAAVWLTVHHRVGGPRRILASDVSWDTLLFLGAVVLLTFGFRNAGVVEWLAQVYRGAGIWTVGAVSAIGSALINNHPMGHMNMLAIDALGTGGNHEILAALVGGDLGPRLLPTGSLAGLLWYASLQSLGVHVPLWRFVAVGAFLTAVTLPASLWLLSLLG